MTNMEIPQAAIEAVARQVFFAKRGVHWDFVWADEEKRAKAQQDAIDFARAGLLAALPHLLAEVKVLTEKALRLGRKEAAEDIARTANEIAEGCASAAKVHRQASIDATTERKKRSHMSTALMFKNQAAGAWAVRDFAEDYPYETLQDASDATSGVPGHPEVSEAVRSPQEPAGRCARCHGQGYVPDFTNWDDYHGEPKPKPCPDCTEGNTP